MCLIIAALHTIAQRQASIWYFGSKAGLDFSEVPPRALYNSGSSAVEGCAAISDGSGNIVLYTNGVTVTNRKHVTMKNGTGLMGDGSSTSNAVVVPMPGDGNLYYIFTIGAQNQNDRGFRYSIVDIRGDNGDGEVTQKNIQIEDQTYEKLAAIHHCNKTDVWVTIKKWNTNEYHTYLVTTAGINPTPVVSHGIYNATNPIGALKFSANGKKLAAAYSYDNDFVELMDFDNTTGILSNPVAFQPEGIPPQPDEFFAKAYGAEFSPGGQFLYISSNNSDTEPCTVYQFDISTPTAAAIMASRKTIAQLTDWVAGGLQIGPDQKIYLSAGRDTALSVIENPDLAGPACNFQYNKINLKGPSNNNTAQYGLPGFLQSYFDPHAFYDFSRLGDCTDLNTKFGINKTLGIDSVKWDFGDGGTSTLFSPVHTYAAKGHYTINLVVYKKDCSGATSENISHTIWIAQPTPFLGADTGTCSLSSFVIGTSDFPAAQYLWNTGATTATITASKFGTYWMQVTEEGCSISDSINIYEKPKPIAKITGDTTVCINKSIILTAADPSVTSYLWNTGETTPSIRVNTAGPYNVKVTGNACEAADSTTVIWGDCAAYVPTAFTPNGDGLNDYFGVAAGFATADFHMQVLDRWGTIVFISNDNTNKWDGKFHGKPMPNGAYPWYIAYTDRKGHRIILEGTVMLLR